MPLSPPSLQSVAASLGNRTSPGTRLPQTSGTRSQQTSGTQAKQTSGFHLWGEDGFTFGDILDVVNPLQHLPIISTVYRALTGKTISPASRVLGDTLFGGPIGAAVGAANALLEYESGKDVGEHVLALLHISSYVQQAQNDPTLVAGNSVVLPSSVPPIAAASTLGLLVEQRGVSSQAANRDQFMVALDAYARNSRMLNSSQRQIPQGRMF